MKDSTTIDRIFEQNYDFSDITPDQAMGQIGWRMVRHRAELILFLHHRGFTADDIAEIVRATTGMQRDMMDMVHVGLGGNDKNVPRWKHPMEDELNAEVKKLLAVRSLEIEVLRELPRTNGDPVRSDGYDRYTDEGETATLPMLDDNGRPYGHFIDTLGRLSPESILKWLRLMPKPHVRTQPDL